MVEMQVVELICHQTLMLVLVLCQNLNRTRLLLAQKS
jgi:hypothetical protein